MPYKILSFGNIIAEDEVFLKHVDYHSINSSESSLKMKILLFVVVSENYIDHNYYKVG